MRIQRFAMASLVALTALELSAVQGTISTGTDSKSGDIKWQSRTKQYIVSLKKGSTMIDMEIKLGDVVSLDIPKPAGYDKAVAQVEGGQGSSAIGVLAKIVSEYRMLEWDKPACRYLALAYLAANNAQKAYDECVKVISDDRSAAYTGELAPAYWQALLKLGKRETLEDLLGKAVASGSRNASAAALVMRGDILVNDANGSSDKILAALRDGYLRVALMYTDAECVAERKTAMLKAADCFDQLGQSGRAEKLRAEAKSI